jgi:hypothetical protein
VVTINMALAAASIAVKQQHVSAGGLFSLLAVGVVVIAAFYAGSHSPNDSDPQRRILCFDP